ncbi:hypothetical protein EV195_11052 [Tenacibaculum skagerrakense]|uniref:Uncharacterized protein n=1 Tax=Tenacibaculum skagerrakense TaxID=186571 RepID=A0A4R2NML8_9FLAO|nr:hypothetical protein [Tenacibaculum skagerrakense]TCP22923.1 hypothetical protein EV195_11052 [Tenacibaculum skagerrakense]
MNREKIVKFLLFLFLILHLIPLVFKSYYQIITQVNYSLVLALLLVFSLKSNNLVFSDLIMLLMMIIAFFLYVLGYSGTVSALILSALTPMFFFKMLLQKKKEKKLIDLLHNTIRINAILLIIVGIYFYILNINRLDDYAYLSECFGIASINYVSLLFFSFSVIFYLVLFYKTEVEKNRNIKDHLIFITLISCSIFFSNVYLTRSTFIASALLFLIYFKRAWLTFSATIIVFIIKSKEILDFLSVYLGAKELSSVIHDSNREESVQKLIKNSLELNFNFREYMSFSSLLNLFFCLLPFSLLFIPKVFKAFKTFIIGKHYYLLIVLCLCVVLTIYQMDFLSVFTLFFLINFIDYYNLFKKKNIENF